jgi:hypothetical protein
MCIKKGGPDIVRAIDSRRMKLVGHLACMRMNRALQYLDVKV